MQWQGIITIGQSTWGRLTPFGTERTALLAHEACDHYHLVLTKGMLMDDTVYIVIISKLVTPDVQAASDVPATKVIISDVQDAGLRLLSPAAGL